MTTTVYIHNNNFGPKQSAIYKFHPILTCTYHDINASWPHLNKYYAHVMTYRLLQTSEYIIIVHEQKAISFQENT